MVKTENLTLTADLMEWRESTHVELDPRKDELPKEQYKNSIPLFPNSVVKQALTKLHIFLFMLTKLVVILP